ncbi:unnamed protein product, partial [Protopolystoma xenopodis]
MFKATLIPVEKALKGANIHKEAVDDIVIVGGSTRIPKIQKLLQDFFNGKILNKSINPDEAVAYGAAVQAAILKGDASERIKDLLLLDVTSLTLGIETAGGIMNPLISQNTTIPCKQTKLFTTYVDNQTSVLIQVYEGVSSTTKGNNLLGKFELTGIPLAPRGMPQIEVTFDVDTSGILSVSACEKNSRRSNRITINNDKGGLSRREIKHLVDEAENFKLQDSKHSALVIAINNFENYAFTLREVMEADETRNRLSWNDRRKIISACNESIAWLEANRADGEESDFEEKQAELIQLIDSILGFQSYLLVQPSAVETWSELWGSDGGQDRRTDNVQMHYNRFLPSDYQTYVRPSSR